MSCAIARPMMQTRATLGSALQIATGGVQVGGAIATAIGSSGAVTGAATAAWVPFVGPIVLGVTLALSAIFNRKGPKQKVITTQMVNELEPLLVKNRDGYLAGPRTASSQAVALKNFDDSWAYLTGPQQCGNRELGDPGQRCISDRSRGGQWDWFSYYRDPIANDTQVKPDPTGIDAVTGTVEGTLAQAGINPGLALAVALIALGVLL